MPLSAYPTMPPDTYAVTTAFIEALLPDSFGDPVQVFMRKLNEQGWFVVDKDTVEDAAHYHDLCDEPVDLEAEGERSCYCGDGQPHDCYEGSFRL